MSQAFTIESAHLRKAAAAAHSIVSANKAIPILNNVRLDAGAGQLRLLTTDQDCWAELTIPAVVGAEVSTTVAAALLNDIARNSPSGAQVEIEVKDTGASAKAGRARFRLPTLPSDSFPPMNAQGLTEQVRIRVSDLLAAVGAVVHVKAEDNKPHLQGILFRPLPGGIEFAAFDGKRLSRATAEAAVSEDFEPMTMPGPVVAKLRTILEGAGDEITIGHNGRLALIEGNGIRFLTRLVEGSVEEICRIFDVPPHLVGHTEGNTQLGSSIKEQTQGFIKFKMRKRLKRIESAVEMQLLSRADLEAGVSIEFNIEGFLRGDSQGRAEFYDKMKPFMTINQVRALEGWEPVPGGDQIYRQMQDEPLGQKPAAKE